MFALAFAAAVAAQVAPAAAPSPAAAEIIRLEQQWGQAFVRGDFDFIERIVAPGFRLVGADEEGKHDITPRAEWMKNARSFTHHGFTVETVDVNVAGDTAVASAKGVWTVSLRPDQPPRARHFFVTDTWVRRGGQWQVIHRFSQRLGSTAPSPPAATTKPAGQ